VTYRGGGEIEQSFDLIKVWFKLYCTRPNYMNLVLGVSCIELNASLRFWSVGPSECWGFSNVSTKPAASIPKLQTLKMATVTFFETFENPEYSKRPNPVS
jgi:hypothetical protein